MKFEMWNWILRHIKFDLWIHLVDDSYSWQSRAALICQLASPFYQISRHIVTQCHRNCVNTRSIKSGQRHKLLESASRCNFCDCFDLIVFDGTWLSCFLLIRVSQQPTRCENRKSHEGAITIMNKFALIGINDDVHLLSTLSHRQRQKVLLVFHKQSEK